MPQSSDRQWHLDRKVPIAIIGALVMQSLALGWYASSLDSRVTHLETYVAETKQVGTSDRLVRLETHMENIFKELQGISRKLDGRPYPAPKQ